MNERLTYCSHLRRRRLLGLTALAVAGCAATESRLLPILAESYVLLDTPADSAKTAAFSNVIDMRATKTDGRVATSTAVVLGDKDLQTDPIDSIRAELHDYAMAQWKSSDVMKILAGQPIHVREFVLSYTVGPQGPRPIDLSLGPAVAAFDQMMRSAIGQLGDFRFRLALGVGDRSFLASERHQFGANGGVIPSYSSRSLFKKVVQTAAAQIVAYSKA
jgi:hypothetical protein